MIDRRHFLGVTLGSFLVARMAESKPLPASTRLSELGPENQTLVERTGLWDVIETVWSSPSAPPETTTGLVAERRLIGSMLQEFLYTANDRAAILRIDYLSFNRVEGRWDYVSMDTRAAVGIMPAWSFARGDADKITLTFEPFALPGNGQAVSGRMLRMDEVISHQGLDRDRKDQHFIMADGTGMAWLAHQYSYTRRERQ
jgi:hypothetical protein